MTRPPISVAVLGLGEAGTLYARGLGAEGAAVRGYDPFHRRGDPAIRHLDHIEDVLEGADVVLSLVGARASIEVAEGALPFVAAGAVYADLNTASPETKLQVARIADGHGVLMTDVAVLAPVPIAHHRTALLASGPGSSRFAEVLAPWGPAISILEGAPGDAARLKLLRSVFMKGMAALVIEALGAASARGVEPWLRDQISAELGPDGAEALSRLITGTYAHAARRKHEVRDALAEVEDAGQPADITRATLAWFERIVAEREEADGSSPH